MQAANPAEVTTDNNLFVTCTILGKYTMKSSDPQQVVFSLPIGGK